MIKVFMASAILYAVYRLAAYNNTLFRIRRCVLLAVMILPALVPFINIPSGGISMGETLADGLSVTLPEILFQPVNQQTDSGISYPVMIYAAISLILFVRFMSGIVSILRLRGSAAKANVTDTDILIPTEMISPFSFFRMIFINPSLYKENELREIMTHENTHKNQHHSIDVILSEIYCIIFWINPFAWLIKREIRINLEYLADEAVITNVAEATQYQYNLLRLGYLKNRNKLVNNYNVSQLKKRIKFMNTEKSKHKSILRYLLLLPVSLLIIFACSESSDDELDGLAPKKTTAMSAVSNATNDVFTVVEDMPEFPGGVEELMNYIKNNMRYPQQAIADSVQGRVITSFVIDTDGSVINANILRGVTTELDEEALRVVEGMPKWKPGKQRGVEVKVKYTLPITFRLE